MQNYSSDVQSQGDEADNSFICVNVADIVGHKRQGLATSSGREHLTTNICSGSDCFMIKLVCFVYWLPNIPATCLCISGTGLLRQMYVLPH